MRDADIAIKMAQRCSTLFLRFIPDRKCAIKFKAPSFKVEIRGGDQGPRGGVKRPQFRWVPYEYSSFDHFHCFLVLKSKAIIDSKYQTMSLCRIFTTSQNLPRQRIVMVIQWRKIKMKFLVISICPLKDLFLLQELNPFKYRENYSASIYQKVLCPFLKVYSIVVCFCYNARNNWNLYFPVAIIFSNEGTVIMVIKQKQRPTF